MKRIRGGRPGIGWLADAARRPEPQGSPGAEPPPAAAAPGLSAGSFEQVRYVFHELHAEGRHALCEVCGH